MQHAWRHGLPQPAYASADVGMLLAGSAVRLCVAEPVLWSSMNNSGVAPAFAGLDGGGTNRRDAEWGILCVYFRWLAGSSKLDYDDAVYPLEVCVMLMGV